MKRRDQQVPNGNAEPALKRLRVTRVKKKESFYEPSKKEPSI
jgi:hypothetical protein